MFWVKTKALFPFEREQGFLIMPGARDGSGHICRERQRERGRERETNRKTESERHTHTHRQREKERVSYWIPS